MSALRREIGLLVGTELHAPYKARRAEPGHKRMPRMRACLHIGGALMALIIGSALAQDNPKLPDAGGLDRKPIDILGIQFGMTGAQARPLVAAHAAAQRRQLSVLNSRLPFIDKPFVRRLTAVNAARLQYFDELTVLFSGGPSGNQAVFVRRDVRFSDGERPNRAALLKSLEEKFGMPSRIANDSPPSADLDAAYDYFFSKGGRVDNTRRDDMAACSLVEGIVREVGRRNSSADVDFGQALLDAIEEIADMNARHRTTASCDTLVLVRVTSSTDESVGRRVPNMDAIGALEVIAFDIARLGETYRIDWAASDAAKAAAAKPAPTGGAAPPL